MGEPHEYSTSLRRRPEGPLTPYIDAFLRLLSTQGYSRASILLYTRLVADFSRWLKNKGVSGQEITADHAGRYLRTRARPARGGASTLKQLLNLLRQEGVIKQQATPERSTPAQRLLDEYASYLRPAPGHCKQRCERCFQRSGQYTGQPFQQARWPLCRSLSTSPPRRAGNQAGDFRRPRSYEAQHG